MVEPAAQSKPTAEEFTQGHSIWLIVLAMLLFPPCGVYLLEGACDFQVGINVVAWFFFITPSYIHGFGLLIYKRLWPKLEPSVHEFGENIHDAGYLFLESAVTAVEKKGKDVAGGVGDKLKDAVPDSSASAPS